ncbi:Uncharacterised protein [BD1-7 clade bacterium]|uniref:Uncharacterized protein n=1 Tax=BD1-7 clade bacterium TaxID=2029982 RepID=A0A5S9R0N0_9GAMM|nr:Uncharacterised protein [BD1-7 clade bacterium]
MGSTMKNVFVFLIAIVSIFLISGCDDNNDSENGEINEFIGLWKVDCYKGFSGTFDFQSDFYSSDIEYYEDENCIGNPYQSLTRTASVKYGNQITTDSGVVATELDIIVTDGDSEDVTLDLIYRDGNKLYAGQTSEYSTVRPTDIDFDFYWIRVEM